jgi:uncharacterized protein (TIGR03000 family)
MKHLFKGVLFALAPVSLLAFMQAPADAGRGSGHSPQYAVGRSSRPAPPRIVYVPVAPAAEEDYAYGSSSGSAEMTLKVPRDAEIWFNGAKMPAQENITRSFVTPPLDAGWDYSYDVRVRWTENNRPVDLTRKVLVRAGDRMTLNLIDRAR